MRRDQANGHDLDGAGAGLAAVGVGVSSRSRANIRKALQVRNALEWAHIFTLDTSVWWLWTPFGRLDTSV